MAERTDIPDIPWPKRLASAIVLQAVADYVQGLMCTYDSSCLPANLSSDMAGWLAVDSMKFFKSNWCKELTDMDMEQLAHQLKESVPEFVNRLRSIRPVYNEKTDREEASFVCPNCGGTVKVWWYYKKSGVMKGKCTSCVFNTIYNVPRKELMELGG